VNTQGLCGATDWRVPTMHELHSITHHGRVNPAIDQVFFPNTISGHFWSDSPWVVRSDYAWYVYFFNGIEVVNDKSSNFTTVRLVRRGD